MAEDSPGSNVQEVFLQMFTVMSYFIFYNLQNSQISPQKRGNAYFRNSKIQNCPGGERPKTGSWSTMLLSLGSTGGGRT